MIAAAVCSVMVGCGGAPEENEPVQSEQAPAAQAEVQESAPKEGTGTVSAMRAYTSQYSGAAFVTFHTDGDRFAIQDTAPDGHSAVLEVSGYGTYLNPNGAGTTKNVVINFPEGVNFTFRACTGDYGTRSIRGCPSWTHANSAN